MGVRSVSAAANHPPTRESVSLRHLWRFLGFSLPYWPSLTAGVVTGLIRMVLGLFMPWYVKYVIDDVGKPYVDGRRPPRPGPAWAGSACRWPA